MATAPRAARAKFARIQAEIAAAEGVTVELRGEAVGVKPFGEWPMEALEDLNDGRYRSWSEECLTEEGFEVWQRLRPTVDEVLRFFSDYNDSSGQDLGKSRAS